MSPSFSQPLCRMLPLVALSLSACGGGGSGNPVAPPTPTLASVALSPLSVTLDPNASVTLTVTGTYSDGSTQILSASGEAFTPFNTAVTTVNAAGVVVVVCGAPAGATATITATDLASKLSTAATQSTQVTVSSKVALCTIALQPPSISLPPKGVAQLTVMGSYSDGSTQALPNSSESFSTSNTAVATVSAAGVITVPAGAAAGATATVTAKDVATGLTAVRVLLVEDDLRISALTARGLAEHGFTVDELSFGGDVPVILLTARHELRLPTSCVLVLDAM